LNCDQELLSLKKTIMEDVDVMTSAEGRGSEAALEEAQQGQEQKQEEKQEEGEVEDPEVKREREVSEGSDEVLEG